MYFLFVFLFLVSCGKPDVTTDTVVPEAKPLVFDPCSQEIGQHPCNFTFKNQHGDEISLYDSYGKIIIVDLSVMWCGPCQSMGRAADGVVADYGPENVEWLTLLIENEYGETPVQADLQRWADVLGITGEVLGASREIINPANENAYPVTGWPTYVVIDQEMILRHGVVGWNEQMLRGILDSMLQE